MPSLLDMSSTSSKGGRLSDLTLGMSKAPSPRKAYGYEIREPYEDEHQYFKENPRVAGMATDDGRIIVNKHSGLKPIEQDALIKNEASRLLMREKGYKFDFDVTPEQMAPFQAMGDEYSKPENYHHLQSTILARIISGDPSAGNVTPQQQQWANRIRAELEARR